MNFFFEDLFKKDPDKSFIINYAPLFASLSLSEKKLILERSKVVEYNKGDVIYKQSDPPGAFYCVISGRVRIFSVINEKKETLEYLHYGKYFGMISLLTGSPHSVNAEAANDSKVLKIDKADFEVIVDKIPKLAVDLSKTLSHRLNKSEDRGKKVFENRILSVFSAPGGSGHAAYAIHLALSLKKETGKNVILINICNPSDEECRSPRLLESPFLTDSAIKSAMTYEAGSGLGILNIAYDHINNPDCVSNFNALLASLTSDFHFIVVYLPVLTSGVVFQILSQSDLIHVITDSDVPSLQETKTLISGLLEKVNYPQDQIKIIVNADKEGKYLTGFTTGEEVPKLLDHKVYATLPPCSRAEGEAAPAAYEAAIRKIARDVGDVLVGLALGGGAAFGLAHIGVIKAFEEERIPVDVVAGSSMGAVVGALWAVGLDSDELEKFALEFSGDKRKVFRLLVDPGFSKLSFFQGKRVKDLLERYLGDKTFQDTRFPFKVVACNLSKRKKIVYDSGRLLDAVMASLAIPGVFSPGRFKGDLILDGGIIEPVPIGTLLQLGIKKVIAVNVLPSPEDIAQGYELKLKRAEEEKKKAEQKGFFAKVMYQVNLHIERIFFPNVFDIIVNSVQILQHVIAERDCAMVDVVLRPISPAAEWFEFFKGQELIKIGEEEARNSMPAIKALIAE